MNHRATQRSSWTDESGAVPLARRLPAQTHRFPAQALWCALPEEMSPQLPGSSRRVPTHEENWLYELQLCGCRVLARIDAGDIRLVTGNGVDWTTRLLPLRRALASMQLLPGWYDGEIVVFNERGAPDIDALQRALASQQTDNVELRLFDLPYLDNYDLRRAPLVGRRGLLERLLENKAASAVRVSEAFQGPALAVLPLARKLGMPGLIAKRKDAPYQAGRQATWLHLDGEDIEAGQREMS